MASEFELLATIVNVDTFFQESNMEPVGNLLRMILRTCHEFNDPRFDATMLNSALGNLIAGWLGAVQFPEEEGTLADWGDWAGEHSFPRKPSEPEQSDGIA